MDFFSKSTRKQDPPTQIALWLAYFMRRVEENVCLHWENCCTPVTLCENGKVAKTGCGSCRVGFPAQIERHFEQNSVFWVQGAAQTSRVLRFVLPWGCGQLLSLRSTPMRDIYRNIILILHQNPENWKSEILDFESTTSFCVLPLLGRTENNPFEAQDLTFQPDAQNGKIISPFSEKLFA